MQQVVIATNVADFAEQTRSRYSIRNPRGSDSPKPSVVPRPPGGRLRATRRT